MVQYVGTRINSGVGTCSYLPHRKVIVKYLLSIIYSMITSTQSTRYQKHRDSIISSIAGFPTKLRAQPQRREDSCESVLSSVKLIAGSRANAHRVVLRNRDRLRILSPGIPRSKCRTGILSAKRPDLRDKPRNFCVGSIGRPRFRIVFQRHVAPESGLREKLPNAL